MLESAAKREQAKREAEEQAKKLALAAPVEVTKSVGNFGDFLKQAQKQRAQG